MSDKTESQIDWDAAPTPSSAPATEASSSGIRWDEYDDLSLPKAKRAAPVGSPDPATGKIVQPGDYIYEPAKPVGSFYEGLKASLTQPGFAVARMLNVPGAEENAKLLGEDITNLQGMGKAGAFVGDVFKGGALPFGTGPASIGALSRNMLLGGGIEALNDYGSGATGDNAVFTGGTRGALGTAVGTLALNTAARATNLAASKAGVRGRWRDDALDAGAHSAVGRGPYRFSPEDTYEFLKARGVPLRPGDLDPFGITRGIENIHVGSVGTQKLSAQADALGEAMFGQGSNKLTDGLERLKDTITKQNASLWDPVYQLAAAGTTPINPATLYNKLQSALHNYPKLLKGIDHAPLKDLLKQIRDAPDVNSLPQLTFEQMRLVQHEIGPQAARMKARAVKGDISVDQSKALNGLYGATHADLTRWGAHPNNTAAYDAYKEANEIFKREILPFRTNDIVSKWEVGKYDAHNERLLQDLTSQSNRTQQNQLHWYAGHYDPEMSGWLSATRLADRGMNALRKGIEEPSIPSLLGSGVLTAGRLVSGAASGKSRMVPWYGMRTTVAPDIIKAALPEKVWKFDKVGQSVGTRLGAGNVGGLGQAQDYLWGPPKLGRDQK